MGELEILILVSSSKRVALVLSRASFVSYILILIMKSTKEKPRI